MTQWWQDAVVYQVYLRSFADGNGDGTGDLDGLRSRLPYLADLGIDAIWVNPWYVSPLADGGYDVADYRRIDPRFGSVADVEALVRDAHTLGIRVIADIVPNHTSSEHEWFQAALRDGPGSAARARYWFRPGRGENGDEPPNDWESVFGDLAWTRVEEADGSAGEWYLHIFDAGQPDLNWSNPEVAAEFLDILRFWFDRGIDGFRIDVAHGLIKDPDLPDMGAVLLAPDAASEPGDHPHWDREEVHEVYRAWRKLADSYDPPKVFVGEVWVDSPERLARYRRDDELHTAFDFGFAEPGWNPAGVRRAVDTVLTRARHGSSQSPATWVLSNHDIVRHVTRLGLPGVGTSAGASQEAPDTGTLPDQFHARPAEVDLVAGRRRARAAAMLMLALPGSAYLYQGEELGLEELLDIPPERRDDPIFRRTGGERLGRDGCRVPLPWTRSGPSFGFGDGEPWLPQSPDWGEISVAAQEADPHSMLTLYRQALRLRRELSALGAGNMRWDPGAGEGDLLTLHRDPGFTCSVNFGPDPVEIAPDGEPVLSSLPLTKDGMLPGESAVWLVR